MNDTQKLVSDLSEQVSRLVRDELRLAKLELTRKGKRAGLGAGVVGAAGIVGLFGGAVLVTAIVLLLALVMPAWLAAAIVAVVLLAAAAVLGMAGKKQVQKATPPVPEETIASVKADIDAVKEGAHR
ncbi:phage holin family protein [Nonomuraea sp. NPDC048826]|uniref:phage holin family protein n=1 Tax=Nonomuraea sp. NPDC048826 TaxID=3364347 RepID=UPI00371307CC